MTKPPEGSDKKHPAGRWQPGQSGNPAGRNRVLAALDQIGEGAAHDVLQAAIARAVDARGWRC